MSSDMSGSLDGLTAPLRFSATLESQMRSVRADAEAARERLGPEAELVGFGHSLGGAPTYAAAAS